jgi:cytochrome c biogenesis protein CcdA/DsbC/DsbD-like thiol-disulfide interchange protein
VRITIAALVLLTAAIVRPAAAQIAGGGVTVQPLAERASVPAGETLRLALQVKVPAGLHLQADRPRDKTVIPARLTLQTPANVTFASVAFPGSTQFRLIGFDEPLDVFGGDFVVGVTVTVDRSHTPGSVSVPATFRYQACDDTTCFNPVSVQTGWTFNVTAPASAAANAEHADVFNAIDFSRAYAPAAPAAPVATARPTPGDENVLALFDRFTVAGKAEGYLSTADFSRFIEDAEAGVTRRGLLEGRGPIAVLAIVFLGGLALNLTPCVLPMIPINLAIIGAGAKSGRRGRGFLLGSAYGSAMALVYGVLGLVVILTAGTFGAINSSAWFNFGIAALFVFLGLAMFDVVSLDFSRFSSGIRFDESSRGTVFLAFAMGAVAALLAGACVAPVVVQVVVFASDLYARGDAAALALPFVLGLGMALPWPIAGAGLASLPKPGPWMVRVKHAMGVFILATAAYYAWLGYGILAARWVDPADVRAGVEAQLKAGWYASLRDGLQKAEKDNSLVLVDFWATWCKNCLVMDQTTLKDPDVLTKLSSYTKIKFQAEDVTASPARELMQRVGGVGLPTYVILRPSPSSLQPAEARPVRP